MDRARPARPEKRQRSRSSPAGTGHISCPLRTSLDHLHLEREMADDKRGKATHLTGKIKEGVGELLGDDQLEREGEIQQAEGRAEQDVARAEDALIDAEVRRRAAERARKL
jgi:uncharacterized protein YjbJ (UPF0337 family)